MRRFIITCMMFTDIAHLYEERGLPVPRHVMAELRTLRRSLPPILERLISMVVSSRRS